jgi:hypothetical protein
MNETGLFHSLIQEGRPRDNMLPLSGTHGVRCANLERTLNVELLWIGLFDLLDHLFFLLFCARFSRGTKGRGGPARQAKGCFLRGSQETSLLFLFLGGTANPKGVRQLTDKAEARRAASAQASFPSRRACEKAVPEKVMGIIVWVAATRRDNLLWCRGQPLFGHFPNI